MLWLPMVITMGSAVLVISNRTFVGLFFLFLTVFCAFLSSFNNFFSAKKQELAVFIFFLFLSYAAFHEIIKHSLNNEVLRYMRDGLFVLVVTVFVASYAREFLTLSSRKILIFGVLFLGLFGMVLSNDIAMALWAYRDSYLYALCAILAMAVASHDTLMKFSYLVISIAMVNLVVGVVQQLGGQEFWLSIGYGDIATSVWQGMQRPWGTFDRSLTYGHFLLLGAVLAFFIVRMPMLGILLLLGSYLSFNRSVLVSSLVVTLVVVMSNTYRSSRMIALLLVIVGGMFIYPLVESVLLSLFDPDFRSNSDRISDYLAILSLGFGELLLGGQMGLVGSNAGRFSLGADFTSGIAHIHSGYLTLILELGLIGALLFLMIIAGLFIAAVGSATKDEKVCLSLILIVFALSMFTHNMQSNIPNNIFFWAFFGVFAALPYRLGSGRLGCSRWGVWRYFHQYALSAQADLRTKKQLGNRFFLVSHVSENGGAERVLLRMASALVRAGNEVHFYAPTGELLNAARGEDGLLCREIPAIARKDVSGVFLHTFSVFRANTILIHDVCCRDGVIVVNAPRVLAYLFPVLLFCWRRRISLAHDVVPRMSLDRVFGSCMRCMGIRVLPVSAAIANSLGISDNLVLPNPVFTPSYHGGRRPHQLVRLGIVSNIAEWKGHLLVLKAITPLLEKDVDLTYEIYGKVLDVNEKPYLQRLEEALDTLPNARYAGYTDNPWETYCQLDIVIQASLRAEQPLTLSEAISAGCHIISPSGGGECEVIRCWPDVTWFERGEVESLREALKTAIGKVRADGVVATDGDYLNWLSGYTEEDWMRRFLSFAK